MIARSILYTLILGVVISTGWVNLVSAQDEKTDKTIAWFDVDHCDICKNMASMKTDMHKIKWDVKMLDDGMLMVSVVPKKMKAEMDKAQVGVQATVKKLESGEKLDLCGFCQSYGNLMEMGADIEDVELVGVNVTIIRSTDPEVVKKIQAFGKQSKTEHNKMLAKIKSESKANEEK
jgi:hypothetical protein